MTSSFVPTRIIDVSCGVESMVRLSRREHVPVDVRYVTLSHCWGKARPLALTKLTEGVLQRGFFKTLLPLTFQHAIEVIRRFQIRYLWFDSL